MRLVVFIVIVVMMSCTKDIEIDQVSYQTKIVVDGWIENDGRAHVLLTRSSPFLTDYDSASIRNTFLNYAKVVLIAGNGQSEILTLTKQDAFFPPFVYKSTEIKGEVGETYQLEVHYQNKIITSTTTIPELPNVNDVFAQSVSDTSMIINASVIDDGANKNYYYSQILTKHFDTRYHPSDNPLRNDRLFNGKEHVFQIKRSNQPDPLNLYNINSERNIIADEFAIDDTVFVKVSQIDEEAYRVLNGIYIDHLSQNNPFSLVDQQTHSNINGGIGRWTGLATQQYTVHNTKPHN